MRFYSEGEAHTGRYLKQASGSKRKGVTQGGEFFRNHFINALLPSNCADIQNASSLPGNYKRLVPTLSRYTTVHKEFTMSMATKRSLGPLPLLYPEPVLLVGTYDRDGKANVMAAAWGGICSSEPLSLMVAVRPERWTHDALLERKAFTVSIASESITAAADFMGIASGRRYDKFAMAGLTAVKAEKVDAPYVGECPVVLECALSQTVKLGVHTMMIGEILDVKADEDCLDPTGKHPDIAKVAPLIYDSGARAYYGIGKFVAPAFSVGKALLKDGDA